MSVTGASDALAKRHTQATIIAKLALGVIAAMQRCYHNSNVIRLLEHYTVMWVIRVNDENGGEPVTIAEIAKILTIPRTNVKRGVDALIKQGAVRKVGTGYAGNLDYLAERIDVPYFKETVLAILKASDELRETL